MGKCMAQLGGLPRAQLGGFAPVSHLREVAEASFSVHGEANEIVAGILERQGCAGWAGGSHGGLEPSKAAEQAGFSASIWATNPQPVPWLEGHLPNARKRHGHKWRTLSVLEGSPFGWRVKVLPILLFAAAIALTVALWPSAPDAEPATVFVRVDGPDSLWFEGDVVAGTMFDAMAAVATREGWPVVVDGRVGDCTAYVKEIRGVGEEGAGGWVYEIKRDGNWTGPIYTSADCTPLLEGDLVWWHWTATGEYEAEKEWEK